MGNIPNPSRQDRCPTGRKLQIGRRSCVVDEGIACAQYEVRAVVPFHRLECRLCNASPMYIPRTPADEVSCFPGRPATTRERSRNRGLTHEFGGEAETEPRSDRPGLPSPQVPGQRQGGGLTGFPVLGSHTTRDYLQYLLRTLGTLHTNSSLKVGRKGSTRTLSGEL